MNDKGAISVVFAVFAVIIGLAVFSVLRSDSNPLDRSALGTKGFALWLAEDGVDARIAHRLQTVPEDDVLLRILPLYDVNLNSASEFEPDPIERRGEATLRDLRRDIVRLKMQSVETLLILPKWRAGVLELGLLDRQLRIRTTQVQFLLQQVDLASLQIVHPDTLTFEDAGLFLYRPQLFDTASVTGACKPALAVTGGVLIAKCQLDTGRSVHVLSDPDFMNNHGLTAGNNADLAKAHIASILRGREGIVYFDTADELLLQAADGRRQEQPQRQRSGEELSRFLSYPFNIILLSIGMVFFIAFWRGLIRFGPPARDIDDGIGASKTVAIDAKANLLRLVGQDAALTRAFVSEQVVDLSHKILGKSVDTATLMTRLKVLSPTHADNLDRVITQIQRTHTGTSSQQLLSLTQEFETTYRRLIDELGHISRRR